MEQGGGWRFSLKEVSKNSGAENCLKTQMLEKSVYEMKNYFGLNKTRKSQHLKLVHFLYLTTYKCSWNFVAKLSCWVCCLVVAS